MFNVTIKAKHVSLATRKLTKELLLILNPVSCQKKQQHQVLTTTIGMMHEIYIADQSQKSFSTLQYENKRILPFLVLGGLIPLLTIEVGERGLLAGTGFIDDSDFLEEMRDE